MDDVVVSNSVEVDASSSIGPVAGGGCDKEVVSPFPTSINAASSSDNTADDLNSHPSDHTNQFASGDSSFQIPTDVEEHFIPTCEKHLIPYVGKLFTTLEEGIAFYKKYALECGFDIRNSTKRRNRDKNIELKYMLCNRQGFNDGSNNSGKRETTSNRVGCTAKIAFKLSIGIGYIVSVFVEHHTHNQVDKSWQKFMKANRNMDIGLQKFMSTCSNVGVGVSASFKLYKALVGGYSNVGALLSDFKNHRRDVMEHIIPADAQMVIDRLSKKQEVCSGFYFAHSFDSENKLTRLFWADSVSRKNYSSFGEVVSFDSTFDTNKYKMVFAPFTGYDNHKRCITFAAGLLAKEDADSYVWLFEHFKKAMGGNEPRILVTDQDLAMKTAVPRVFPSTRHRLCMWHIMSKVSEKVGPQLSKCSEFLSKLNAVVCSYELEPAEFELEWKSVMSAYGLEDNPWFNNMFDIRQTWIPAYYRDVLLGGLIRVTSISESQNSMFSCYTNPNLSLVEFLMHFENALDTQRHAQDKLNYDSDTQARVIKTQLALEKHASEVFTLTMFKKVQVELCAAVYSCSIVSLQENDGVCVYVIKDGAGKEFQVEFSLAEDRACCRCKMFERIGIPCRHMLLAFKNSKIDRLPKCVVLARWTKSAALRPVFTMDEALVRECNEAEEKKLIVRELWSDIYTCVALIEEDKDRAMEFLRMIKSHKASLVHSTEPATSSRSSSARMVKSLAGISPPAEVNIHPPDQAKNKGSGKRIKGGREKAVDDNQRAKRRCAYCKKFEGHDIRNCNLRKEKEKENEGLQ